MEKVFITKYCLTSGIIEIEADIMKCPFSKKGISVWGKLPDGLSATGFFNDDFHLTREDAVKDANKRRAKKIENLIKQMKKLENLCFE